MEAISIQHLTKEFQLGSSASQLREAVGNLFAGSRNTSVFKALDDLSLEINHGDSMAIIGKNGAGKSTLLKILSRITPPTKGEIIINGRVNSLLEVGTGFHPELTGRENIYLNGAILGMSRKEIKGRFDEIVDFSGVEKFLNTPVKRYSSGMYVRLAFAVAAHLEPEIFIVDEVLAVGDAEFQKKCLGKMDSVSKEGRTVLFVSHNMASIQKLCNRGVLLEKGKLAFEGTVADTINAYLKDASPQASLLDKERADDRLGKELRFDRFELLNESGLQLGAIHSGANATIRLHFKAARPLRSVVFRIQVSTQFGQVVCTLNNFHCAEPFPTVEQDGFVDCLIPKLPLFDGQYSVTISCLESKTLIDHLENAFSLNVEPGDFFGTGKLPQDKAGLLVSHTWKLDQPKS